MRTECFEIVWTGIRIEILYTPDISPAYRESYGQPLGRLEVRSLAPEREPLPITETGYLSQYVARNRMEETGKDPAALVLEWLDHEAQSPLWKAKVLTSQQLDLFS